MDIEASINVTTQKSGQKILMVYNLAYGDEACNNEQHIQLPDWRKRLIIVDTNPLNVSFCDQTRIITRNTGTLSSLRFGSILHVSRHSWQLLDLCLCVPALYRLHLLSYCALPVFFLAPIHCFHICHWVMNNRYAQILKLSRRPSHSVASSLGKY